MATWEEMINGTYNPVNAVNERHQQLLNQRQAANMQRMQAANPGFQSGGYGTPAQYPTQNNQIPNDPRQPIQMPAAQQFQQFGPPSIAANQDEWLKSQFDLAEEHLGGIGDPEAAPAVAAQAGGPIGGGQGGGGPNSTGGAYSGAGLAQFGETTMQDIDPLVEAFAPLMTKPIQAVIEKNNLAFDKGLKSDSAELDSMLGLDIGTTYGQSTQSVINDAKEALDSFLNENPQNVFDLDPTDFGGVGLGGASDNSGFGGAGGEAVSGGSQGAMGNEGPGQSVGGDDGGDNGGGGGSGGGPNGGEGGGGGSPGGGADSGGW